MYLRRGPARGAGTVALGRPDALDDGTTARELLRAQRQRRQEELLLISPSKQPPAGPRRGERVPCYI